MKIPKKVNETENFTHTHQRDEWSKSCDKRKIRMSSLFPWNIQTNLLKTSPGRNFKRKTWTIWTTEKIERFLERLLWKAGENLSVSLVAKSKLPFSWNISFAGLQLDSEPCCIFHWILTFKRLCGAVGLFYFISCIFVIKKEKKSHYK